MGPKNRNRRARKANKDKEKSSLPPTQSLADALSSHHTQEDDNTGHWLRMLLIVLGFPERPTLEHYSTKLLSTVSELAHLGSGGFLTALHRVSSIRYRRLNDPGFDASKGTATTLADLRQAINDIKEGIPIRPIQDPSSKHRTKRESDNNVKNLFIVLGFPEIESLESHGSETYRALHQLVTITGSLFPLYLGYISRARLRRLEGKSIDHRGHTATTLEDLKHAIDDFKNDPIKTKANDTLKKGPDAEVANDREESSSTTALCDDCKGKIHEPGKTDLLEVSAENRTSSSQASSSFSQSLVYYDALSDLDNATSNESDCVTEEVTDTTNEGGKVDDLASLQRELNERSDRILNKAQTLEHNMRSFLESLKNSS